MSGSHRDSLVYTLHRYALSAAGWRLIFDKEVFEKLNMSRGVWMS